MKLRRHVRPFTAEEVARFTLVERLEAIDDPNFTSAATRIASEIRKSGSRAAARHASEAVAHSIETGGAWARLNPVVGALTVYAADGLGADLTAVPPLPTRRRLAGDRLRRAQIAAEQRHRSRAVRTREAQALRRLDTLRRTP